MQECPTHAKKVSGLPPRRELRCTRCGHRVPYFVGTRFVRPTATRYLPPWCWLGEIVGRFLARRVKAI